MFYIGNSHDIKEPCGVSTLSTRNQRLSTRKYRHLLSWRTSKPAQVQTGLLTLCGFQRVPQLVLSSPSFSRTHHHPLTTNQGLRGPQTHDARLNNRVSAHRKRAPEIVDESLALLGMNCAMLRNLAAPRPARRAQRTHWRRMFGAQVDTNPSHRCPSLVRLSPALVSAPPHVPVRPFVWGCGS